MIIIMFFAPFSCFTEHQESSDQILAVHSSLHLIPFKMACKGSQDVPMSLLFYHNKYLVLPAGKLDHCGFNVVNSDVH